MRILVTGATGKVGRHLVSRLLADPARDRALLRALCHSRTLPDAERVETVFGSISDRDAVRLAMDGVTHVVHLATCKETPDEIMDVAVKGLFWLLEAARESPTFERFVLIGGDAAIGHFHHHHAAPITESLPHNAYPGCYALSKVIEEAMLEQYYVQYDLDGCCLRAPWIMEKDDFRYTLSFGEDVFGGPRWCDLVEPGDAERYRSTETIPLLLDADGRPLKRSFVHVDDLASAILIALDHPAARQQLFNVGMDEPVDYGELARHLERTRGFPSVEIPSGFHGNWLDVSKAKHLLGWRPRYDLARLVEEAWSYERADDDPRRIWYPG